MILLWSFTIMIFARAMICDRFSWRCRRARRIRRSTRRRKARASRRTGSGTSWFRFCFLIHQISHALFKRVKHDSQSRFLLNRRKAHYELASPLAERLLLQVAIDRFQRDKRDASVIVFSEKKRCELSHSTQFFKKQFLARSSGITSWDRSRW